MALYFSGEKVKIRLDGRIYSLNIPVILLVYNEAALYSSDNYVLMSSDGYVLVAKEEEVM